MTITSLVEHSNIKAIATTQGGRLDNDLSTGLRSRWTLPLPDSTSNITTPSSDYTTFQTLYKELADVYKAQSGSENDKFIYLEVDAFLNYLFHEGNRPSKRYEKQNGSTTRVRKVVNLDNEIYKHLEGFNDWMILDRGMDWRIKRHETVSTILNEATIEGLTYPLLRTVADCLNCMNSYQINKVRFCNPENNSLPVVIDALHQLIHGEGDTTYRIRLAVSKLKYFGTASAQEILGFYSPDIYPLRNGNSNAGLRYFGFNVED